MGCPGRAAPWALIWPDEATAEVHSSQREPLGASGGGRHDPAGQSLADRYQSDGAAACSGAVEFYAPRASWRDPGRLGWEGIHLYEFELRAAHYGSWEVAAASPDVTLAALRFRKGARFLYEYDQNIPWRHEVRRIGGTSSPFGK